MSDSNPQQGSTIEDKLDNHPALLAHYWGKDWLETYGEYPKWESLDSVQQEELTELLNLITTETKKARIEAIASYKKVLKLEETALAETDRYDLLSNKQRKQLVDYHTNCLAALQKEQK